ETALAGTGYCTGFASCTAAVVFNEQGNLTTQSVWSLWSNLDNGGFNFPRTLLNTPINCVTRKGNGCGGQMGFGVGVNASGGRGVLLGCRTHQATESTGQDLGSAHSADFHTNDICLLADPASGSSTSLLPAGHGQFVVVYTADRLSGMHRAGIVDLGRNAGG